MSSHGSSIVDLDQQPDRAAVQHEALAGWRRRPTLDQDRDRVEARDALAKPGPPLRVRGELVLDLVLRELHVAVVDAGRVCEAEVGIAQQQQHDVERRLAALRLEGGGDQAAVDEAHLTGPAPVLEMQETGLVQLRQEVH